MAVLQYVLYLLILVALGIPLGKYMFKVYKGDHLLLTGVENWILKLFHVDKNEEMNWKQYLLSVVFFSLFGLIFLFLLQVLQAFLPFNPEHMGNVSWHLAFNTAASFVTNTNWQSYSGEVTLSYLSQFLGLTVQNFVSAATGIAVMFALIRGFSRTKTSALGSFWVDMVRIIVHILIPLNLVVAILLMAGGVVQTFRQSAEVSLVEPIVALADEDGNLSAVDGTYVEDGVAYYADGTKVEDAVIVDKGVIPLGPAASQVAIKQTGTNGGGFYGVNSSHPLENPNPFTNIIEMISLLLIPVACCFTFGYGVANKKQGLAIFLAMFIMPVIFLGITAFSEAHTPAAISDNNAVASAGNMEGKEVRFGIPTSVTWAVFTTAASNGSVNSMHDSYTPIGGLIPMLQMMLGEVVLGGVGCGLYGMIGFAIFTVFIAGLMVGRTPEFLGKKIEPREMKWAVVLCLATPFAILVGSAIATLLPSTHLSLSDRGFHGLSEILYNYSSAGGNNGSAFAGFNANTPFFNVSLGLIMIFVRFLPIVAALAIAGSISEKKKIAVTAGTLSTTNGMFVFLLVFIVILVGALSFLPALSLGPIAEAVTPMAEAAAVVPLV